MPLSIATLLILLALGVGSASAAGIGCPKGTRPNGETLPEVHEAWCEVMHDGKTVLHGPYRTWWPNGKRSSSGQYQYGKAVGKWTGWFPSGRIQGEEWFENGVIVKARYFDEQGKHVSEMVKPNLPSQPTPNGASERRH